MSKSNSTARPETDPDAPIQGIETKEQMQIMKQRQPLENSVRKTGHPYAKCDSSHTSDLQQKLT